MRKVTLNIEELSDKNKFKLFNTVRNTVHCRNLAVTANVIAFTCNSTEQAKALVPKLMKQAGLKTLDWMHYTVGTPKKKIKTSL